MKLFLVFREGVYRHECVAVAELEDEAKALALDALKAEKDHYHNMTVVSIGFPGPADERLIGHWRWSKPRVFYIRDRYGIQVQLYKDESEPEWLQSGERT